MLIDSAELAGQVGAFMDDGVRPDNAYSVTLEKPRHRQYRSPGERLVWTTENDGEPKRYGVDPETTWWKRITAGFIGVLPIESQL